MSLTVYLTLQSDIKNTNFKGKKRKLFFFHFFVFLFKGKWMRGALFSFVPPPSFPRKNGRGIVAPDGGREKGGGNRQNLTNCLLVSAR